MATINSKHQVRQQVASIGTYFADKITALNQIDDFLGEWNLQIDPNHMINLQGDEGHITLPIVVAKPGGITCECCDKKVATVDNMVVYAWYKMQSGRYEITTYIS